MTVAQRQFLVKVEGLPEYFNTKTGGNRSSDASRVYNGGQPDPEVLASPATTEDVTVSRGYDPYRDSGDISRLRSQVGKWRTTVSMSPTDEDLVVIGEPTVYSDALLIGVSEPEYNSDSGDPATYELTFAVGSVR